jgi:hypothetical protein
MAKAAFIMEKNLYIRQLDWKKLVKCYFWSTALCGAETWTLRKVVRKYLESFETCWRRMGKISWTDRVRNDEVIHRVKEEKIVSLRVVRIGRNT